MSGDTYPPCIEQFLKRPFRLLEVTLQKELALYLNITSATGKDWRDVAEKCEFSVLEMKYIASLTSNQGSCAMNFLEIIPAHKPHIKIRDIYEILQSCKRFDALEVFHKKFTKIMQIDSENAQPLDLSNRKTFEEDQKPFAVHHFQPHQQSPGNLGGYRQPSQQQQQQQQQQHSLYRAQQEEQQQLLQQQLVLQQQQQQHLQRNGSHPNYIQQQHQQRSPPFVPPSLHAQTRFASQARHELTNGRQFVMDPSNQRGFHQQQPETANSAAYRNGSAQQPPVRYVGDAFGQHLPTSMAYSARLGAGGGGRMEGVPSTGALPLPSQQQHHMQQQQQVRQQQQQQLNHIQRTHEKRVHNWVSTAARQTESLKGRGMSPPPPLEATDDVILIQPQSADLQQQQQQLHYEQLRHQQQQQQLQPPLLSRGMATGRYVAEMRSLSPDGGSGRTSSSSLDYKASLKTARQTRYPVEHSTPVKRQALDETQLKHLAISDDVNESSNDGTTCLKRLSLGDDVMEVSDDVTTDVKCAPSSLSNFDSGFGASLPSSLGHSNSNSYDVNTQHHQRDVIVRPKHHQHQSNSNHLTSSSSSQPLSRTARADDKLRKETMHALVISKLKNLVTSSSHGKIKGKVGVSEDGSESRSLSQVPTTVESTYGEGDETGSTGDEQSSAQGNMLARDKCNTYPLRSKDLSKRPSLDIQLPFVSDSADAKLESAVFRKEPRGRVFVTYDTGVTGDDWDRILKDVLHIRTNVKNNQFSVTMDTASNNSEPVRKAIRKNFEEADFVLICISPSYSASVRDAKLQRNAPSTTNTNNARSLYKLMQHEVRKNSFQNRRLIPVLICGAEYEDSPPWFQRICPKETFYRYPDKLRNLLYHLMRPNKVMDRFMDKQKLQRDSVPYQGTRPKYDTEENPITM